MIRTTTFGSLVLTGKDAEWFERRVANPKPNRHAAAMLERGRQALRELERHKGGSCK